MANEDKYNDDHNNDPRYSSNFDLFSKLLKPIKTLFDLQLRILKLEFKRESERFIEGITALLSGCFFITLFWILVNVLVILAFNEFLGFKLFFSVLIDTGFNLLLSVILFLRAKSKFKKEFFEDTKKIFEDTIDDLKQ